jgi:hypothetical protein
LLVLRNGKDAKTVVPRLQTEVEEVTMAEEEVSGGVADVATDEVGEGVAEVDIGEGGNMYYIRYTSI